jgi:hypothetical protein
VLCARHEKLDKVVFLDLFQQVGTIEVELLARSLDRQPLDRRGADMDDRRGIGGGLKHMAV